MGILPKINSNQKLYIASEIGHHCNQNNFLVEKCNEKNVSRYGFKTGFHYYKII